MNRSRSPGWVRSSRIIGAFATTSFMWSNRLTQEASFVPLIAREDGWNIRGSEPTIGIFPSRPAEKSAGGRWVRRVDPIVVLRHD